MAKRPRRNYMPVFKAKVAIELAQQFDVHPNQITQWRNQLPMRLRASSTARRRPQRRLRRSTWRRSMPSSGS